MAENVKIVGTAAEYLISGIEVNITDLTAENASELIRATNHMVSRLKGKDDRGRKKMSYVVTWQRGESLYPSVDELYRTLHRRVKGEGGRIDRNMVRRKDTEEPVVVLGNVYDKKGRFQTAFLMYERKVVEP